MATKVTVAGEVTDVRGPTFLLVTPRAPGSSIFVAHRVQPPPVEDTVVKVTGALREVDATHLEEELEIDVPRDVFERFKGDLIIAATAVDD